MPASCQFAAGVHLLALLAKAPDSFQTSHEIAESTLTNPVVVRPSSAASLPQAWSRPKKGPAEVFDSPGYPGRSL